MDSDIKRFIKDERDLQTLADQLPFLLSKTEQILSDSRISRCEIQGALIANPLVTGPGWGVIQLGVLLSLWRKNLLIDTCKECGGRLYLTGAAGSVLSGSCTSWGVCVACASISRGAMGFSEIYHAVIREKRELGMLEVKLHTPSAGALRLTAAIELLG